MTLADITTGVQTVTATGAVTATTGLDISAITGDWSIVVEVTALTAGKKAEIVLEDSVNAFTAALVGPTINPQGSVPAGGSKRYTFRKYEFPSLRFGTSAAVLRANVTRIDASSSLGLHAWVEY